MVQEEEPEEELAAVLAVAEPVQAAVVVVVAAVPVEEVIDNYIIYPIQMVSSAAHLSLFSIWFCRSVSPIQEFF